MLALLVLATAAGVVASYVRHAKLMKQRRLATGDGRLGRIGDSPKTERDPQ